MCIAIASERGYKLPDEKTLKNCWNNNPDGAGFAFENKGKVQIHKGFMKFDDFINALNKANKFHKLENKACLIHFRITTHGGTNPKNTHPFPISSDIYRLKATRAATDYACIHNGIIDLTSADARKEIDNSDTQIFIRDYLSLISNEKNWNKKEHNLKLIERLIGTNKIAFLDSDGSIQKVGAWKKYKDNYYSNDSYNNSYYGYNYDYLFDDSYYSSYETNYRNYNKFLGMVDYTAFLESDIFLKKLKAGLTVSIDGIDYIIKNTDNIYIGEDYGIYEKVKSYRFNFIGECDNIYDNGKQVDFYEFEDGYIVLSSEDDETKKTKQSK